MRLLENIVVIDFSQFLSGPSAGLRLADLGAEVIKIERLVTGDICRQLYVSDITIGGESTIFHAINRNKKSFAVDLKNTRDADKVRSLLKVADVLIHNFRPGVMRKLGFSYEEVKLLNPGIVYAGISGYGNEGEWKDRPGQDLLVQAVSGLTHLSGNSEMGETPMGVAVADIYAGAHLVQGILAALYQRNATGTGSEVSVSMLESVLDFQFEVLTCFYNDGRQLPARGAVNSAHAYLGAPYGIYKTSNGYIALAMSSIPILGELLGLDELKKYKDPSTYFKLRDEIKTRLAQHLVSNTSRYWLDRLELADIWCAEVLNYDELMNHEGYKVLEMQQRVVTSDGLEVLTTRCPIRIDGHTLTSSVGAPYLGEHNRLIEERFNL